LRGVDRPVRVLRCCPGARRGDEDRADGFHGVGKIGIPPPKHHDAVTLKGAKLLSRAERDGTTADHDHDGVVRRWHVQAPSVNRIGRIGAPTTRPILDDPPLGGAASAGSASGDGHLAAAAQSSSKWVGWHRPETGPRNERTSFWPAAMVVRN
jgi:hypothetical protein